MSSTPDLGEEGATRQHAEGPTGLAGAPQAHDGVGTGVSPDASSHQRAQGGAPLPHGSPTGTKRRTMYRFEVAEGHRRKKKNILVDHEMTKVCRAVAFEDGLRRNNPEKYPDHEERDNALVKRLVKRFPHVEENAMRHTVAKVREREMVASHGPTQAEKDKAMEDEYRRRLEEIEELKVQLSTAMQALQETASHETRLEALQSEKEELEERLKMVEQARARDEDAERCEAAPFKNLTDQHHDLEAQFEANVEKTRDLEAKLKATSEALNSAQTDAAKLPDLEREKARLETSLTKLQESSQAARERAKKWDDERTAALALVLRQKEEMAQRIHALEASSAASNRTSQELQALLHRNQVLQDRVESLESMNPMARDLERFRHVVDIGATIERRLKDLQRALHNGLCEHETDRARLLFGDRLKMKTLTHAELVDLAVTVKKAVCADGKTVSLFNAHLNQWREMRNAVAHNPGAYVAYARSDTFEDMRVRMDNVRTIIDGFNQILSNLRDPSDKNFFLSNVMSSLLAPSKNRHR